MVKSIRLRLQLWYAGVLVAVVAGFAAVLYVEVRAARVRDLDAELEGAAAGGPAPPPGAPPPPPPPPPPAGPAPARHPPPRAPPTPPTRVGKNAARPFPPPRTFVGTLGPPAAGVLTLGLAGGWIVSRRVF